MKTYDFSKGKRGAALPAPPGKERITIRLDADILDFFREAVDLDQQRSPRIRRRPQGTFAGREVAARHPGRIESGVVERGSSHRGRKGRERKVRKRVKRSFDFSVNPV